MRKYLSMLGIYFGILVVSLFSLFPFGWLVSCSFKLPEQIFTSTPIWTPRPFTLRNYLWALGPTGPEIPVFFKNTIIASTFSALLALIISAPAAYSISRFPFPGRSALKISLLLFQMFRGPLVIITWYMLAWQLGILDTPIILVLAYGSLSIPVCTWLLIGFFKTVPMELEEAAMVDGCNRLQVLTRIVLPIAAPGMVASTLFAFILAWNDYLYALILTSTTRSKTIQIGLFELLSFFGQSEWGGLLAAGVLATLPVVIIFVFLQRYIVSGLAAGAIKG